MGNAFKAVLASVGNGYKVTVTCDSEFAGLTITCTDGTTTYTKMCPSSSPYIVEFAGLDVGTWTISGTSNGILNSIDVIIEDSADLHAIPVGSTITPVNNIQIWLHCANIWDKNYTTLAQVLADTTTLQALIANNNAVDYMVRSTDWCDDGQNDIPAMTGYDTPSGEVIRSNDDATYPAWQVFDMTYNKTGVTTTIGAITRSAGKYLGYHFPEPVVFKKMVFGAFRPYGDTYIVEASNDGTTYVQLASKAIGNSQRPFIVFDDNETAYSYYRFRVSAVGSSTTTAANLWIPFLRFLKLRDDVIQNNETAMQYIGLNDYCATKLLKNDIWADAILLGAYYSLVLEQNPDMTSNTAPSGTCSAQAAVSGQPAYYAYDNSTSTYWCGQSSVASGSTSTRWVQYEYDTPLVIKKCHFTTPTDVNYHTSTATLAGSNDGTTFTALDTKAGGSSTSVGSFVFDIPDNNTAYKYYRLTIGMKNANSSSALNLPRVYNIRMFGRRYIEE